MAYFVITHPYTGTPFVINLQDSAAIAHARAILAGTAVDNKSVGGPITFAPVDYNIGWSYHIAPEDVVFGDAWITVVDDNFIPGARLVAELNEISGTAGADVLEGGDLADIILGEAGDDHISGGAGDDHLIGDTGDDSLSGGSGNDKMSGGDGSDNFYGDEGNDQLFGGAGNDHLSGGLGDDTLDGGGGADIMFGGNGNDRYFVDQAGDVVVERANEGGEDWVFTSVSYGLNAGAHVEVLGTNWAGGTAAINLTGNELAQSIYGNAGANIINGGGADRLIGGSGNDIYVVNDAQAVIAEGANEGGEDWVFAGVSYGLTAGAYVEVLGTSWAGGTAAIDLTGNERAQSIYGNAGANSLNGGGGNDRLIGGAGADKFVFTGAAGNDIVSDFLSGTDKIDLSAYGITAAQVSSSASGGNTLLSIDSNRDGAADFTITLIGAGEPASGDFIF